MQKINSVKELKNAIVRLENEQKSQSANLRDQFHQTTKNLSPSNLIKSALAGFLKSPWMMLIGAETIKSFGHRLIDRLFSHSR